MGVDAVTGAATDHKPNPVIVTLEPVAPPARVLGHLESRVRLHRRGQGRRRIRKSKKAGSSAGLFDSCQILLRP